MNHGNSWERLIELRLKWDGPNLVRLPLSPDLAIVGARSSREMLILLRVLGALVSALLVNADTNSTSTLFGAGGPQLGDVRTIRTGSGWFEIPITGVLTKSPKILTSMVTDVNGTHVSVRMWVPPTLSSNSSVATVIVRKRSWDGSDSNVWPAAFYDAFQALYQRPLPPQDGTADHELETLLNAKYLFSAIQGHGFTSSTCPADTSDQLFLAAVNTPDGMVVEGVTWMDLSNDTVAVVQRQTISVGTATLKLSTWSANCLEAWVHA